MASVNFNMRLDTELRDRAFPIIESFGLSPAQAFKLFLTQIAATHSIPLSFDYQEKALSARAQARLRESLQQMENGEYSQFDNVEALIQSLHEKN